jgi:hypothetical protein
MTVGTTVGGYVDSYSTRRTNLMTSSHFYTFSTTGGDATILMRIGIAGLGPGNNPGNNDLDIFLYDVYGRMIDKSDTGLNGQSERMSDKLPASTYVVEVRSYYTKGETGNPVYNSGDYKLSVSVQ